MQYFEQGIQLHRFLTVLDVINHRFSNPCQPGKFLTGQSAGFAMRPDNLAYFNCIHFLPLKRQKQITFLFFANEILFWI